MIRLIATLFMLAAPGFAAAQGNLVLYCAPQEEWCRAMVTAFERKTGIKVAMTRKSSGEIYAQIKAESSNPRGDIWWGGTGDPHLQAAEEGLLVEYRSPMEKDLAPWALRQAKDAKYRTVGVYAGVLGFGYNTELLARKKLPEPKCWNDLASEKYRDEVQVADPNSSGTSYTMLATLVQLYGEDKAFDLMKRMHKNINQYTKSGAAPAKAAASGETLIGITFLHDLVTMAVGGAPLKLVAPCEGTGYEVGSMSLIKGGKNQQQAKAWYDWALTPEAQALGAEAKAYQIPSNKNAKVPPQAPRIEQTKVIDYDFGKYGSSAERKRLLSKWDKEVKALPK
jgi:iron(III) transport system substrate-binding protein